MRRRPRLQAALSGAAFGLGLAVLLQQFAVAPLTVTTLLGLPALGAAGGWGLVWLGARRAAGGRS